MVLSTGGEYDSRGSPQRIDLERIPMEGLPRDSFQRPQGGWSR
jgi:hypothetical protein